MQMQMQSQIVGIVFNLFALEGWHLAECVGCRCIALSPTRMPTPSEKVFSPIQFQRQFYTTFPNLYNKLKSHESERENEKKKNPSSDSLSLSVCWAEVEHWMYPLFLDRWSEFRRRDLQLSAAPW